LAITVNCRDATMSSGTVDAEARKKSRWTSFPGYMGPTFIEAPDTFSSSSPVKTLLSSTVSVALQPARVPPPMRPRAAMMPTTAPKIFFLFMMGSP
jgi:hypothetical protein